MQPIKLAHDTIDREDVNSLIEWLQQDPIPQLTKGIQTLAYENEYAKSCGRKYAVFVNSGSSANLLAIYSLIETKRLRNKKIIIPALCWITTISPAVQFGLQPILCDIDMYNLSVDIIHLEKLFVEHQPDALFLVSILGISPKLNDIKRLCDKYDVILLLDNCESQGSKYKDKHIESYGLISTCSSYFGHITSTIEGGMITTDDYDIYCMLKQLRSHGWARDLEEERKKELQEQWLISGFTSLYTFYSTGFNCRNSDMGAFIGLRQLKKLPVYALNRHKNYLLYDKYLKNDYWKAPVHEDLFISNLGYPVLSNMRDKIVKALQDENVEVRPLISSSISEHPMWIKRYGKLNMPNASILATHGMYLPNHNHLTEEQIKFVCDIINRFT